MLSTISRKLGAIATVGCAAALAIPAVAGAQCADMDAHAAVVGTPRIETATHCLINDVRTSNGLWALGGNPYLYGPAMAQSAFMAQNNEATTGSRTLSHIGSGKSTPDQRMAGYASFMETGTFQGGENLYAGLGTLDTPRQAVKWWWNSPTHKAYMLSRNFAELGVGVRIGSDGWVYYTSDFAAGIRK